jgi:hypothetical protein
MMPHRGALFALSSLLALSVTLCVEAAADGDVEVEEELSEEQKKELEESEEEVEALRAQVEALKEQKQKMKDDMKSGEIEALHELLAKMTELQGQVGQEQEQEPAQHESVAKVEQMMNEIEAKRKLEESGGDAPLVEDELHACALLAARRYTAGSGEEATAVHTLLTRFAAGGEASSALSAGEAAKSAVFRGVAVCLKQLGEDGLAAFIKAGGFGATSAEMLAEDMVEDASGKKKTQWQGEVFQLSFNKSRWAQLRRAVANHLQAPVDKATATRKSDEL